MKGVKGERECVGHSDQQLCHSFVFYSLKHRPLFRGLLPPPRSPEGLVRASVCMNGAPWRWAGHRVLCRKPQMVKL